MLKRRMEKEITDIDFLTKEQLKQKVTTILKLVTEFDDHVFEINNIGWTREVLFRNHNNCLMSL